MPNYERYEREKSKLENLLILGLITPEQYDEKIIKLAKECNV